MKFARVFLASSIVEFEYERVFLGDHVRRLNDDLLCHDIQIRLFLCEDDFVNSQRRYNREIEQSDLFIAFIGERLNKFTEEEITLASGLKNIKKRVIVLKNEESRKLINSSLSDLFEIAVAGDVFLDSVFKIFDREVNEVLPSINRDNTFFPVSPVPYTISIPLLNKSIENAALGNVIRRLNDQGNNIKATDDYSCKTYDTYIALIKEDEEQPSELERVRLILSYNNSSEILWLFTDSHKYNRFCESIVAEHHIYPEYYERTCHYLTQLFDDKLRSALMSKNRLDGNAFLYIIEDHFLIRKNYNGGKTVIANLLQICDNCEVEQHERRERVIVNLLNLYWQSRDVEKHNRAISELMKGNYLFFAYTRDDIFELRHHQFAQASLDFIHDQIENINKCINCFAPNDLLSEINKIYSLVEENKLNIDASSCFFIFFQCGALLSYYNSLIENVNRYYLMAWKQYLEIACPSFKDKTYAKQCFLLLCHQYIEQNAPELINEIIIDGAELCSDEDLLFKICVQYYEKLGNGLEFAYESSESLRERLDDAEALILYIDFRSTYIKDNINDIKSYREEIVDLYNKFSKNYRPDEYPLVWAKVNMLIAVYDDNLSLCNSIISSLDDSRGLEDKSINVLNLFFMKAFLLKRIGEYNDAKNLYIQLSQSYKGKIDKAYCLQSAALCCMLDYRHSNNLLSAEDFYHKSLLLFRENNNRFYIGNVCHGLSYCYLLQRKFSMAEDFAKQSISEIGYSDDRKYCNYISALVCERKYLKAWVLLFIMYRRNRGTIISDLIEDWNNEITGVGIDKKLILRLFVFNRRVKNRFFI